MSVKKKKRVSCGLWLRGAKSKYTKWVTGPEPVKFPSKPCNGINRIKKMVGIFCWCAYFLSIKTSPVTPIVNRVTGSSGNSLNLTVHWEIRCLFKISTEFVGVKIKAEIKRRNGFCKRLNARLKLFPVVVERGGFQWQTEFSLVT